MQNVTDNVRTLVDSYAKVTLHVYVDGVLLDVGIGLGTYTASGGSEEAFSFGNACAAGITMVIAATRPDLKGHRIAVTWDVDGTEYPLLTGKVESAVVSAGRTTVTAWDDMYFGGSGAYISGVYSGMEADAAFSAIAASIGVEADSDSLLLLEGITLAYGLTANEDELSLSAAAGYLAALVGGNAVMTRAGTLGIRKYSSSGWSTQPYAGGASAENVDYTVTGITLQRQEKVTILYADGSSGEEDRTEEFIAGDGTLMVENPLADQASADRIFSSLESLSIRPGSYSFPGGLLLEPGDLIQVESMDGTYTVAAVTITMEFDGGVKTTVACGGDTQTGGAQGPINQALNTLMADFARIRSLVAENATIVSARITNLSADDITAGRIRSTDYATVELQEIYPASDVFPQEDLYPNNGEQIIRGIEVDFEAGVIRGVFFNSVTEDLSRRVEALENSVIEMKSKVDTIDSLTERLGKLENSLVYPKSESAVQAAAEASLEEDETDE